MFIVFHVGSNIEGRKSEVWLRWAVILIALIKTVNYADSIKSSQVVACSKQYPYDESPGSVISDIVATLMATIACKSNGTCVCLCNEQFKLDCSKHSHRRVSLFDHSFRIEISHSTYGRLFYHRAINGAQSLELVTGTNSLIQQIPRSGTEKVSLL